MSSSTTTSISSATSVSSSSLTPAEQAEERQKLIVAFLKRMCFPFTLMNLLIATALFFMYTAIAITNNAISAYVMFLVFFISYLLILIMLFMRNTIIVHTMLLSLILFMGFYNYLPLFIVKNASPNNYIALITAFSIVGSLFIYYYGYKILIDRCYMDVDLPDCAELKKIEEKDIISTIRSNLFMTLLLSFIGAFVCDSIIFGCLGPAYFPNYVINSNIDVCSRPTKQSFKCNMYKDGKIVS
jgi:predicted permease